MTPIIGKKPQYETWLDKQKLLTERVWEERQEEMKLEKKPKSRKIKVKKFVTCQECGSWIVTSETGGHCGKSPCIHL